ncbi:MAG: SIS domain-containing protein [Candidatus Poseidoniales archaeon]|jgi:glucose/mannose-6-phosphate isomerase|tara:strand:- start:84 stop:1127 length:1044 start_codon:yes stop_codon:yes gene_type:complete
MKDRDLQKIADELDSQDMIGFTRNFIDDFETSISRVIDIDSDQDWAGVLCLGMGGSGAGGMFLSTLADNSGGLPFVVWRDYGLPSWWGPEWLVIATSYSGNTEETISGVREVLDSGGTVIGISSGGEMKEILSNSDGSLFVSVPGGQMPRSAFGHLFGTQLSVCWSLGIMEKPSGKEINDMIQRLRSSSIEFDISGGNGLVVTMAESMLDNQIGIIAPTMLISAARRFANQLNENSDVFARPSELPEMNHNEIVAWASTNDSQHSIIYFSCEGIHPRVSSRMNWMLENIENHNSWIIDCEGESLLERLLYASHISDWISIALALLRGVDPSEMASIDELKSYISKIQ